MLLQNLMEKHIHDVGFEAFLLEESTKENIDIRQ